MSKARFEKVGVGASESIRDVVARWPRSGETQARYCERQGIPLSTFSYWRRRMPKKNSAAPAIAFHEVTLSEFPESTSASVGAGSRKVELVPTSERWSAEIAMPSGIVVRVGFGLESSALKAILEAVLRAC